jgi:hypothetical protein
MGDATTGDDVLLRRLPTVYAVALRLDAAGASSETIGDALGVAPDAVPALLDIGRRKLEDLRRVGDPTDP